MLLLPLVMPTREFFLGAIPLLSGVQGRSPDKPSRETAEINYQKIYIPTLLATRFLMKERRVRLPDLTWICRAEGSAHARPTSAGDN